MKGRRKKIINPFRGHGDALPPPPVSVLDIRAILQANSTDIRSSASVNPPFLSSLPPFCHSFVARLSHPHPSSFPPFRSRIAQKSNEFIGQVELPGKRVAKRNPCFPIRCDLCSPFTSLSRSNVARYCFPPRLVGEKGGEARNFSGLLISSKGTKDAASKICPKFHERVFSSRRSSRVLVESNPPSVFIFHLSWTRGTGERDVCFILFWEIWEKVDTSIEIRWDL